MEDKKFEAACVKAVISAAKGMGVSPDALVRILNENAIATLIECVMRIEDATADGRIPSGTPFHKAMTMLGATLDVITDIAYQPPAIPAISANDNKSLAA